MATIEMTKKNFEEIVKQNPVVLIDFWATWCPPCKVFEPVFEEASKNYPDIVFAKVNTESDPGLAAFFEIRAVPTLVAFREQIAVYAQAGAVSTATLDGIITRVLKQDMTELRDKKKPPAPPLSRSNPRRAVQCILAWQHQSSEFKGEAIDLSFSGVLVATAEPPPIGSVVTLYLPTTPHDSSPHGIDKANGCTGRVVRHTDGGFAADFDTPSETFCQAIAAIRRTSSTSSST